MAEVFLERTFDAPLAAADVLGSAGESQGCFGVHRINWRGSALALDGRRMLCHFQAPDAESVRVALRFMGADTGRVWPGTIHEPSGTFDSERSAANVLVERQFEEPVALEAIQAAEDAHAACLEANRVTFLRTYFSLDRKRMICLYHAPDAESVRLVQREAQMPFEDVWSFSPVHPPPDSPAPPIPRSLSRSI